MKQRQRYEETPGETPEVLWYATTAVQLAAEILCALFPKRKKALVRAYKWWLGEDDVMSPARGWMGLRRRTRFLRYFLLDPKAKVAELEQRLMSDTVFDVMEVPEGEAEEEWK